MKSLLLIVITFCACAPAPAKSQNYGAACDFSSSKPLIISRPPRGVVVRRVAPKIFGTAMTVTRSRATVRVKILIDRAGDVVKACAVRGHPLLREAARQAAVGWKFKRNFGFRGEVSHDYVQSWIEIVFRFKRTA